MTSPGPNGLAGDPRKRAALVSLVAGSVICGVKLLAYALTHSTSILTDGLESIINIVAAALLLYSMIVAARPADRDHPYGHGKVEFFSAGFEGALIMVAGLAIFWEAGRDLWRGPELERLDVGVALVVAAAIANAALGLYLMRVGNEHGSLALVADGKHVLTDVVTSAAVVVGLGLVWLTGLVILDPIVAILLSANILRTGWKLVRESVGGLMDEADMRLLDAIADALERNRQPEWIDVHSLRAFRSGSETHVDLHLVVPRYYDADQLHDVAERVETAVLGSVQMPGDVIAHFDPCRPHQCRVCRMPTCPVRKGAFVAQRPITGERATREDEPLTPTPGQATIPPLE